jgi:L-lactate dehydrogenase (cytochrome)
MHDLTANGAAIPPPSKNANFLKNQRHFPTIQYLRRGRNGVYRISPEYGGAGADTCIKHNWAALDAVQLVPRYGVMPKLPPVDVTLFGRRYAAPLGVAPMGSPVVVWPGADKALAKAAQRACVPYTLGTLGGATIEEIANIAPDVFWFQLYRFAKNDHAISFDLVKRAQARRARVNVDLDVPVRTTRPRGGGQYGRWRRVSPRLEGDRWDPHLAWLGFSHAAQWPPRFANIQPYAGPGSVRNETIRFARKQVDGAFSWDEVERYRPLEGPAVPRVSCTQLTRRRPWHWERMAF